MHQPGAADVGTTPGKETLSRRVAVALVPFAVGVFGVLHASDLQLGGLATPGPGLWPYLVSALIVLSSMALVGTGRSTAGRGFTRKSVSILAVLASLAVFILVFETLGFITAASLSLAFWLRFVGGESWRLTLILSVLGTIAFQVVFVELLRVPFPDDVVAGLWGA